MENEHLNVSHKKQETSRLKTRRFLQQQKRRRKQLKMALLFAMAVVVFVMLLIVLFGGSCGSRIGSKSTVNSEIEGVFIYDKNTQYVFGKDGTGTMKLDTSSYDYKYTIKGDVLFLDFESDGLSDCQYIFKLEGNVLTLEGKEGTIGGTYTLTKQ